MNDATEYNENTWDDVIKYTKKRKASTKLDDKIKKKCRILADKSGSENLVKAEEEEEEERKKYGDGEEDADDETGIILSDDDLRKDVLKVREKKRKKKSTAAAESEKMQFETTIDSNETYCVPFHQMNLSRPLLKAIASMNITTPTAIQSKTIPVALMGRDICGCAATGTGKTLAYLLPTFERLLYRPSNGSAVTRVLIIVPTRELGLQVYQVGKQLAQFTTIEIGLSVGGLDLKIQQSVLRKNPDVVIATPGRLIDHIINTPTFTLSSIEVLILDEADRMLDEAFAQQMKHIIKQCSLNRQAILFSATMTEQVDDLAAISFNNPAKVFTDSNQDVAFNLRQEFVRIRSEREADREAILAALVCRTFHDHTMIFVQTKQQARRLHILLGLLGVNVGELHGDLSQPQRLENLKKFKDEQIDVLISTDVAARGIDISGVKTVINFTMPATMSHYIHRVGRTARAGKFGVSVSLAGEQERALVKDIIKNAINNPVKNRIIPPDIIEKYNNKLKSLEPDVEDILQEQRAEREIAKMENQANKAERLLNEKNGEEERGWFQTNRERKLEQDSLKLSEKAKRKSKKASDRGEPNNLVVQNDKKNQQKKKKTKPTMDPAEARAQKELEKVSAYQARLAKKSNKIKKIYSVVDHNESFKKGNNKATMKKSKSSFSTDLTDTSRKGVKRLRYDANTKQKQKSNKPPRGKLGQKPGGNFGRKPGGKKGGPSRSKKR